MVKPGGAASKRSAKRSVKHRPRWVFTADPRKPITQTGSQAQLAKPSYAYRDAFAVLLESI